MIPWKLCCNMLEIPVNTPVNIAPQCTWKPCKSCMCAKGGRARKITKGRTIQSACVALENLRNRHNMRHGDGSKPIIIHFSGMNIHLPSFTIIYQLFWVSLGVRVLTHSNIGENKKIKHQADAGFSQPRRITTVTSIWYLMIFTINSHTAVGLCLKLYSSHIKFSFLGKISSQTQGLPCWAVVQQLHSTALSVVQGPVVIYR